MLHVWSIMDGYLFSDLCPAAAVAVKRYRKRMQQQIGMCIQDITAPLLQRCSQLVAAGQDTDKRTNEILDDAHNFVAQLADIYDFVSPCFPEKYGIFHVIWKQYHEHLAFMLDCMAACAEQLANADILKVWPPTCTSGAQLACLCLHTRVGWGACSLPVHATHVSPCISCPPPRPLKPIASSPMVGFSNLMYYPVGHSSCSLAELGGLACCLPQQLTSCLPTWPNTLNQGRGSCSIGYLHCCLHSKHRLLHQGSTCIHWQAALCALQGIASPCQNFESFAYFCWTVQKCDLQKC